MAKCEFCGVVFDRDEAADYFSSETFMLSYENIKKCLCGQCAVDAVVNDKIEDVYFETCENCGCTFDFVIDEGRFADHFPWYNGTSLRDYWTDKILCADCAIDVANSDE